MTRARGVLLQTLLLWHERRPAGGRSHEFRCTADQPGEASFELRLWLGEEVLLSETFSSAQDLLRRAEELRLALDPGAARRRAGRPRRVRPAARH